ncbi:ParB/RepB/Spo0J family partition protein [Paenibacillus sp. WQ 127069]|uniref:ParB/RepB/Spo0J family partition protein n=1 Tax=Paenibacillus baimaensis TaxID=2982185 RepID=A0ABT2US80_9BACL|nr:ParB/RepB/Spo0J family partition protein [Paenibacillus sp. WQ 127069]MCU6797533.1 ParB/RepB/Spo0J family partition protein [Paenibacillus sp. WQ 127069]
MDIVQIPTYLIDEDTDQPRYQFDEDSLQELMNSIAELGLLSPIKVRTTKDGRYKIIYGNRRYKACSTLGKPTIPCIVSDVTDELEIYLEQIAENLTREGFSPIEEADAFNKLLKDPKFSSSTKYLSSKLGKPESYIKNKCDLLKFSNAVKKLIVSGTEIRKDKLTELQVLPLKDLPIEYRDSLALMVARDELSVSDVKKIAKLFKDRDISDNTKAKLLYKSGYELIETWSVFEQNRAERSKQAEAKAATKADKADKRSPEQPPTEANSAAAASLTEPAKGLSSDPEHQSGNESTHQSTARLVSEPVKEAASNVVTEVLIDSTLQRLLATLPSYSALSDEVLRSYEDIYDNDKESFHASVKLLVDNLEKHLEQWKKVQKLTQDQDQIAAAEAINH